MTDVNYSIIVAIDGPSGSGKSTVAKAVAAAAGMIYIDTGAMYRAVAFYNIMSGNDLNDEDIITKSMKNIHIDIQFDETKTQRLILNNKDVTDALRTMEIAKSASIVAAYPGVRKELVALQRELAGKYGVIMDGRDIGTFVLKDAHVKIYLTASIKERTRRRISELEKRGEKPDFNEIMEAIKARDYNDMNRTQSPLKQAEDAILIDSGGRSVSEITEMILIEMAKVR